MRGHQIVAIKTDIQSCNGISNRASNNRAHNKIIAMLIRQATTEANFMTESAKTMKREKTTDPNQTKPKQAELSQTIAKAWPRTKHCILRIEEREKKPYMPWRSRCDRKNMQRNNSNMSKEMRP